MNAFARPAFSGGRVAHPVDHALGAANIDVRANRLPVEQCFKINALILIIIVDVSLIGVLRRQFVNIRTQRFRPTGLVQFPAATQAFHLLNLRQKRRDADAACDEQLLFCAQIKAEQVDRIGDHHLVANGHVIVHE